MSTTSALLTRLRPAEEPAGPIAAAAHGGAAHGAASDPSDVSTRLYRGRSIDELIPRIEAELGADAIVVRRRKGLEGGIGGFFQRPFVEVEAKPGTPRIDLYDELSGAPALPPALQAPGEREALAADRHPTPALRRPAGAYVTDTLATIAAAGIREPAVEEPVVENPPRPAPEEFQEFRELIPERSSREPADDEAPPERLADTFSAALAEAEQALPKPPVHTAPDPFDAELERIDRELVTPRSVAAVPAPRRERARANIERSLIGLGVGEELAQELIDAAIVHAIPFAPRIGLAKAVHGALVARIPRTPLLPARSASVAVIGPGGSGKTSCCAALLSAYRKAGTLPASCATIMLAGEHEDPAMLLSPQIMEPLSISSARARQALREAREDGLLLLDMPPLSPADRSAIRQISGLLCELAVDRVVVALPATLGARATGQLLEALRPLGAQGMAITHADETDQIGVAVEAACKFGLAPEYLLDRGRLRGGLTRIDPTHLADRLLP